MSEPTMNLNGTTNHFPEDDDEPSGDSAGDGIDSLTPRQQKAIVALINEPTIAKASEVAAVPVRTLYRWLDDQEFSRAYRKARRETFAQAIALSQRYAALAVQTLAQIVNDRGLSGSARVTACATILKFGRESIELDDLAARVEALESAEAERGTGSSSSWRGN